MLDLICHMALKLLQNLISGDKMSCIFFLFHNMYKVFFDFSLTLKAAPHERVIRTGQP